jgi:Family of unknown function (DUF6492)
MDTANMTAVALITPTYSHDLERCTLLCESVDRHVTGFANHYLIVPDDELAMFAKFDNGRRRVLPLSQLLPSWLRPLPRFIRRKNRQYWWSTRGKPVNGWHVQQFAKIATAHLVPEPVSCMLDSDVVFFRPFELSAMTQPNPTPLYIRPREVTAALANHCDWVRSSHRLLGLDPPSFPADDFIGHVIFWDQQAVHAMTARIEQVTGLEWIDALYRAHAISEYMLYGLSVCSDAEMLRRHRCTTQSLCFSYWDRQALGEAALDAMLNAAPGHCVAFSSASFNGTSVHDVRTAVGRLTNRQRAWPGRTAPPLATAGTLDQQVNNLN